jgi:hypothetical protein
VRNVSEAGYLRCGGPVPLATGRLWGLRVAALARGLKSLDRERT